jgi:hypothetical protein
VLALGAILQAMLQGILQGSGPVGYCPKVPKAVLLLGVVLLGVLFLDPRFWAVLLLGVLFLDPLSWVLYLLLAGRFIPSVPVPGVALIRSARRMLPVVGVVSVVIDRYAASDCLIS